MSERFRIAIDGPSGAGKSTVAKLVASRLGIEYIDTGAMYRAIGLKMLRLGLEMEENDELQKMLDETDVDFEKERIYLDGEDVSDLIRTQEISKAASDCSAFRIVREKLVELQRAMGDRKSIIMDGRDIGTVVLKDSKQKFYLTATAEERAMRRYLELREKGTSEGYEQVLEDVIKRDYNDSHRDVSPLRQAEDAVLIDSTNMTIDEVVNFIIDSVTSQ
ncbi:MAG: (d)CMP kinase [Firmicutes bacterium]|nr:(d)CMP kinase [Bacillota bacterium]MEE3383448.1 (d)CMP kinase [Anaerovoracaceae bacterium]MBQ1430233.1 (d)CMP kinase [Bacillota bacterium]MBQ1630619.1 (d)CMP kinase [Bacillota bacterium]MBQ1715303.1 (d)CMP kinase [Bacillota bacterium]